MYDMEENLPQYPCDACSEYQDLKRDIRRIYIHGWNAAINECVTKLSAELGDKAEINARVRAVRTLEIIEKSSGENLNRAEETLQTHAERYGIQFMLNDLARKCHEANQTWWHDPVTGEYLHRRNKGELLMLIVSEIAEAMEGERKQLMDDKLPHRRMAEVELVDALIRIFDYAGAFGYDLDGAFEEKMTYNAQRADHKPNVRAATGGKKW